VAGWLVVPGSLHLVLISAFCPLDYSLGQFLLCDSWVASTIGFDLPMLASLAIAVVAAVVLCSVLVSWSGKPMLLLMLQLVVATHTTVNAATG